ncbi:AIPR family protein [Amycolatopsis dendrobii]|uniref:AIPR family protein n=1 Tax=Amycolatopsis dendrobii TaxID=2760662 RepID=A0A7W3VTS1_9PSEU|nr:AIPR family protein [Amycolatopsis dendrobii]MBB1152507.1 AIPR family protein [Amycolatopsis dendrobii]
MSKPHVRFVAKTIKGRFSDLIDVSDQTNPSPEARHQAFLSRGLAALARQMVSPCTDVTAAQSVVDGRDDCGVDAVAVDPPSPQPHIWLIQAKWSDGLKGTFGMDEVNRMIDGLNYIVDLNFEKFNNRFRPHIPQLEEALDNASPRITLVLALMRVDPLHPDIVQLLKEKIKRFNQVEEMVDYKILDLRDFHRALLGDAAAPKIDTRVQLQGFGQEISPARAFYGTMTAPAIADLFAEHRRGLFARNIRDALDLTDVNVKIRNTLLDQPEHFWYFSNGITVLCESIQPIGRSLPGGVGDFALTGASVVNGAQTVSAIHRAFSENPDQAQHGRVLVRLISLENCPPGFGDQVTTNTNTQNPIEDRDFKSLDNAQITLRDEFALALGLSYVIRRGEQVPDPEHGCSITEAAEALAATHEKPEYAALAKRDPSALWQDEAYQELFGATPNVHHVWRSVQLLRVVRNELAKLRDSSVSRPAAMAGYGDLLIAHVVYQQLDNTDIEDPDGTWDKQLAQVPTLVADAIKWSLQSINREFGPKSHIIAAVRNTERIRRVVRSAVTGMSADPSSATERQERAPRVRQIETVKTLLTAERISDGTVLEFRPVTRTDRREMAGWLDEDAARGRAVWRNNDRAQLQWQADKKWYSPTGLVRKMRTMAYGMEQPVQGTLYWYVPDEGSLIDLADSIRAEQDLVVEEESVPGDA